MPPGHAPGSSAGSSHTPRQCRRRRRPLRCGLRGLGAPAAAVVQSAWALRCGLVLSSELRPPAFAVNVLAKHAVLCALHRWCGLRSGLQLSPELPWSCKSTSWLSVWDTVITATMTSTTIVKTRNRVLFLLGAAGLLRAGDDDLCPGSRRGPLSIGLRADHLSGCPLQPSRLSSTCCQVAPWHAVWQLL